MQIIAVVNHKGGVGKTTSAVNIAACWGEMGQKVLLVDLDSQGSASLSFGIKDDGQEILNALQKSIALPVVHTQAEGVDLVPAGPYLANARQRFSGSIGKELLIRSLKQMPGGWEKIIIDCPPSLEILTLAALQASNQVIIPVEASYLALSGLQQMVDTVTSVGNDHPGLVIRAAIPCRAHPRRRVHQAIMEQLEKLYPGKVSPVVRENAALAEAPGRGQPVILSAPKSHGTEDYRRVALWLSGHID